MPSPVRYPSGVSTAAKDSTLFNLPAQDPTKLLTEFVEFTGLDYIATQWTVTETQAGATQNLTAADAAGEHGILRMVNTAGATDLNSIQLTTVSTLWSSGKKFWLKGRISRDNADAGMGFGMQAVNATPFTVVNGIWIQAIGASTDVTFRVSKASVQSTATVTAAYPTSALNTFVVVGMYYDGANSIKCFVNDVHRTTIDLSAVNNVPVVALTPTIATLNTTANARNMDVDYFVYSVER